MNIAYEIATLFGSIAALVFSVIFIAKKAYQVGMSFNSWRLRNHPVEKLLRYAIELMQNDPEEFTARQNISLQVDSRKYAIEATTRSLKICNERLPLNDWQEGRLKIATNRLYDHKGGQIKQFTPLWLTISRGSNVVAANFRRKA